jgi:plasmid stability protein
MTVSITIRDVPDETRDALAARAARSGRSLQEFLALTLRELAAKPEIGVAVDEIRARARHFRPMENSELLGDLDADRG